MIYILEDDNNIRKMLSFALEREGYEVKSFVSAEEMYGSLADIMPELLLLDIMLPGEDGFSVLQRLRNDPVTDYLPVIILTAKNSEIDKLEGLNSGADDYVTKPFAIAELIARVKAVLRRSERPVESGVYNVGSLSVDDSRHLVKVGDDIISLSRKEYDLLLFLLGAGGKVRSREEILSEVWGDNYGESRTLDVHIRKLRRKLGPAGDMIMTIKGRGYRLGEDVDEA